jgi:hypothetical protein
MTYDGVRRLTDILLSIGLESTEFHVSHAPPTRNEAIADFTPYGRTKVALKEAELKAAGLRIFSSGTSFSVALPNQNGPSLMRKEPKSADSASAVAQPSQRKTQ